MVVKQLEWQRSHKIALPIKDEEFSLHGHLDPIQTDVFAQLNTL